METCSKGNSKGVIINCDRNGNDKVSFAFAAAQCERALVSNEVFLQNFASVKIFECLKHS